VYPLEVYFCHPGLLYNSLPTPVYQIHLPLLSLAHPFLWLAWLTFLSPEETFPLLEPELLLFPPWAATALSALALAAFAALRSLAASNSFCNSAFLAGSVTLLIWSWAAFLASARAAASWDNFLATSVSGFALTCASNAFCAVSTASANGLCAVSAAVTAASAVVLAVSAAVLAAWSAGISNNLFAATAASWSFLAAA